MQKIFLLVFILTLIFSLSSASQQTVDTSVKLNDTIDFAVDTLTVSFMEALDSSGYFPIMMDTINNVFVFSEGILGMPCVPIRGELISHYGIRRGRMHTGTDVRLRQGDTVYAAFDGIVTRAGYGYGYGNIVVLDHGEGFETRYAHLSKFLVSLRDTIMSGDPIALGGRTGRATTAHLHFEIRIKGKFYNPEKVFDFENQHMISDTLHLSPSGGEYSKQKRPDSNYHTVVRGDTLYDISRYYGTSVSALCQLNNINKSDVLRIGTLLKVR